MANFMNLVVRVLLSVALCLEIVSGNPLRPEDVESLLPETPKTKNETIAAIVKDVVVQDAVQSVVANGTLSGLVVKKNVVILPAAEPDVILSQKEQILTAPLSLLEAIRKNITETAAAVSEKENSEVTEVEEISLAEVIPLDTDHGDPDAPEVLNSEKVPENLPAGLFSGALVLDKEESSTSNSDPIKLPEKPVAQKLEIPGIVESEIKLPSGVFPHEISLPSVIKDEISEPLVAVLDPENIGTAYHGSVIALLPGADDSSDAKISNKQIAEYGARIPAAIIKSQESDRPAVKIETRDVPELKTAENVVAVFAVSQDEKSYHENEKNDMVPAEDIIFRPLFRYRQEQDDRTRVVQNRAYQKASYNRYRPSSYSDRYYPGQNSYRKNHRTKYYNDYD